MAAVQNLYRVCIRLEMIEFEAGSPSCKLIGLLFQDSQDNSPHPLEDRKKSATLEASKDFTFQASAMFNPKSNNDAKCNLFSFVPCNWCTIDEEGIGVSNMRVGAQITQAHCMRHVGIKI